MIRTFGEKKQDQELAYLKWVREHKDGFVVNWKRSRKDNMTLHRASCRSISDSRKGPFTLSRFFKICCVHREELVRWMDSQPLDRRWKRRCHSGPSGRNP